MLHRCPARSAVAKLAQRAEVVVNANQLVHGGEGEGVGAVGPNVAECAEVALGGGAGGAYLVVSTAQRCCKTTNTMGCRFTTVTYTTALVRARTN